MVKIPLFHIIQIPLLKQKLAALHINVFGPCPNTHYNMYLNQVFAHILNCIEAISSVPFCKVYIMENELVKTFAFHGGLVLSKTILMSPLVGFFRLKNSVSFEEFETYVFLVFFVTRLQES